MATKPEVDAAELDRKIKKIKLEVWGEYVNFFASKALGLSGLGVGGLEILAPNVIPGAIAHPDWVLGVGAALLAGKSIVKVAAVVVEAFK